LLFILKFIHTTDVIHFYQEYFKHSCSLIKSNFTSMHYL